MCGLSLRGAHSLARGCICISLNCVVSTTYIFCRWKNPLLSLSPRSSTALIHSIACFLFDADTDRSSDMARGIGLTVAGLVFIACAAVVMSASGADALTSSGSESMVVRRVGRVSQQRRLQRRRGQLSSQLSTTVRGLSDVCNRFFGTSDAAIGKATGVFTLAQDAQRTLTATSKSFHSVASWLVVSCHVLICLWFTALVLCVHTGRGCRRSGKPTPLIRTDRAQSSSL